VNTVSTDDGLRSAGWANAAVASAISRGADCWEGCIGSEADFHRNVRMCGGLNRATQRFIARKTLLSRKPGADQASA